MIAVDLFISLGLIFISLYLLKTPNHYKSIILFIAFGLILSISWVRLGAVDVALAEAAIGAGITGILLLNAVGHMHSKKGKKSQ